MITKRSLQQIERKTDSWRLRRKCGNLDWKENWPESDEVKGWLMQTEKEVWKAGCPATASDLIQKVSSQWQRGTGTSLRTACGTWSGPRRWSMSYLTLRQKFGWNVQLNENGKSSTLKENWLVKNTKFHAAGAYWKGSKPMTATDWILTVITFAVHYQSSRKMLNLQLIHLCH